MACGETRSGDSESEMGAGVAETWEDGYSGEIRAIRYNPSNLLSHHRRGRKATTPPPPLMCSVSETATHQTMYPGDGICDILMYTDVRLLNQAFEEPIVPASYQLFLELSAKTYKKTTCGISLDVRDDVTVVVIITCVLTVRSLSTCKAMPASAWDPKSNMMSSMKNTIPMKTTSFATNAKIVAFAFQMGVLNYHMPVRFMKPEYAAYQRCTRFAIGSMPEGYARCQFYEVVAASASKFLCSTKALSADVAGGTDVVSARSLAVGGLRLHSLPWECSCSAQEARALA
ncbi:hypothetical protein HPB51_000196 [Rhipicephalus microplus]|uniref:Uncharacterized protein n=1 Tax=Rhipicephalus microplus TaxID=6941 RepID=A0A9J6DYE1_RHIMP|nr:hypothetical protein HPB51_000196 [Rhipicephalus microplus]